MSQPRPRRFLVVAKTMGRCGSTWFCDMLDSHPLATCLGEILNPGLANRFGDLLDAWGTGDRPDRLYELIASRKPESTLVGFKTFREQAGDDLVSALISTVDHVVLIDRRNLTAALVSELHARETQLWHADNDRVVEAARQAPPIVVDVRSGRNRLRNALGTGAIITEMARRARASVVEVTYEDLVASTQEQMNRVFAELDLPPHEVTSCFRKIEKDPSFVANADEVNRELGPEFGYLN